MSDETALCQAGMTARQYLIQGIREIDDELGDGYAKTHPELLAAMIQTQAMDYGSASLHVAIAGMAGG